MTRTTWHPSNNHTTLTMTWQGLFGAQATMSRHSTTRTSETNC